MNDGIDCSGCRRCMLLDADGMLNKHTRIKQKYKSRGNCPRKPRCKAECNRPFRCSREPGHGGEHESHGGDTIMWAGATARWKEL